MGHTNSCCFLFVAYFLFVAIVVAVVVTACCFYGYSGLLVGHTNWGETSGGGVFTQLAHRACIQGMK